MKVRYILLLAFTFSTCINKTFAQQMQDSEYIYHFEKQNVLEINSGINAVNYNFRGLKKNPSDIRLTANTNAYTGFYVNYKWLSINFSVGIPGTLLDNKVNLKHTAFSFRYNHRHWSFIPFYNFYNGLLLENSKDRKDFDAFRDMNFYGAGVRLFYFTNSKRLSYRAGSSFSERQKKSAGSIIITATPQWQHITWKNPNQDLVPDTFTYHLLTSEPQWISLTAGCGYNYNFIFNNSNWIISPACIVGAGALKEITRNGYIQPVLNVQTWVSGGYNGEVFFGFINASWQNSQTQLLIKRLNNINRGISLTLGYRFENAPKKIWSIL